MSSIGYMYGEDVANLMSARTVTIDVRGAMDVYDLAMYVEMHGAA